jgi:hypothetical protein
LFQRQVSRAGVLVAKSLENVREKKSANRVSSEATPDTTSKHACFSVVFSEAEGGHQAEKVQWRKKFAKVQVHFGPSENILVRPTGGCAPDSEVPTLGSGHESGASGALLGAEAGRAQDPPSRRGEHDPTPARHAARHRCGQSPGSSQPTRTVHLSTGQAHCSAQRRTGPRIHSAGAGGSGGGQCRGSRPVLFRIVFLHENGVFFS